MVKTIDEIKAEVFKFFEKSSTIKVANRGHLWITENNEPLMSISFSDTVSQHKVWITYDKTKEKFETELFFNSEDAEDILYGLDNLINRAREEQKK